MLQSMVVMLGMGREAPELGAEQHLAPQAGGTT